MMPNYAGCNNIAGRFGRQTGTWQMRFNVMHLENKNIRMEYSELEMDEVLEVHLLDRLSSSKQY